MKEKTDTRKARVRDDLPGVPATDAEVRYLTELRLPDGWHKRGEGIVQVARDARMLRKLSPTFAKSGVTLRTSFGEFAIEGGDTFWQCLERKTPHEEVEHPRSRFGLAANRLISVFSRPA